MVALFYSFYSSSAMLFPQNKYLFFFFICCIYVCKSSHLQWLSFGFGQADLSYNSSANPDELFGNFTLFVGRASMIEADCSQCHTGPVKTTRDEN